MPRALLAIALTYVSTYAQSGPQCAALNEQQSQLESADAKGRQVILLARLCHLNEAQRLGNTAAMASHLIWIIDHYAELDLRFPAISFDKFPKTADPVAYEQVQKKWAAAIRKNPENTAILADAAQFLWVADRDMAIGYLRKAVDRTDAGSSIVYNRLLGRAYGMEVAGVVSVDKQGQRQFEKRDAKKARSALERSQEASLVWAAAGELAKNPDPELTPYREELLAKAKGLDPRIGQPAPTRIRVGGNVQAARMVHQPKPKYPPLAKQARIQGVVRFEAIIGKDGTVQQLRLVSGHPLLIPAAQEVVKQWVYQPTQLNGEPVEVATTIDVNFALSEEANPEPN